MKKLTKTLAAIILLAGFLTFQFYCKKDSKTSQNTSTSDAQKEDLARAQKFIEQQLKKGITQNIAFPNGVGKQKSSGRRVTIGGDPNNRTNTLCFAGVTLIMKNYKITYTSSAGCSGSGCSPFTYKVSYSFDLQFDRVVSLSSIATAFTTFTLVPPNSSPTSQISLTLHSDGSSGGTDYFYHTDDIDLDALGIHYCDVNGFYIEIWPVFTCSGSTGSSTDADLLVDGTDFSNFNRCETVSPVFINSRSGSTASYSGWVILCSPAHFLDTENFEFSYREVGTSTWTVYSTSSYSGGPYNLTGLDPTKYYEYKTRNYNNTTLTGTTPIPCYGPYSAVIGPF